MTTESLEKIRETFDLEKFRGRTFRDVLLPPMGKNIAHSRYRDIKLTSKFSRKIPLKQVVVPANMLDVTESQMAIMSALMGGIGIIHRFCPIEFQAKEITRVKRAHNFIIDDPFRIRPDASVQESLDLMEKLKIGSLLVSDNDNRLLGLVTERDVELANPADSVEQVMKKFDELHVTQKRDITSLDNVVKILHKNRIKKLPVIDVDHRIQGLITRRDIRRLRQYPLANIDRNGNLLVGATIGAIGDFTERAQELRKAKVDVLVMDVTSAHSKLVEKAIEELHKRVGGIEIVVGNIGTAEQADFLIKLGVQGLKIGIGPGGPCTTRRATGIGVPQLFAVLETYWNLIIKYNYKPDEIPPLCADGGIRNGCDIVFALLAGASSVMAGSIFAGSHETPGDVYPKADGLYKRFRGMASIEALIARYEAEGAKDPVARAVEKSPEGVDLEVKVKGSAENKIRELAGGIQSGISHRGVLSLNEFRNQNPFDRESGFQILSSAAQKESFER